MALRRLRHAPLRRRLPRPGHALRRLPARACPRVSRWKRWPTAIDPQTPSSPTERGAPAGLLLPRGVLDGAAVTPGGGYRRGRSPRRSGGPSPE